MGARGEINSCLPGSRLAVELRCAAGGVPLFQMAQTSRRGRGPMPATGDTHATTTVQHWLACNHAPTLVDNHGIRNFLDAYALDAWPEARAARSPPVSLSPSPPYPLSYARQTDGQRSVPAIAKRHRCLYGAWEVPHYGFSCM